MGTQNGSSMTFLMYCVDPKDHILKALCHYLYFWLRYKDLCFSTGLLKKRSTQTDRQTTSDRQTLEKFNIDWVTMIMIGHD